MPRKYRGRLGNVVFRPGDLIGPLTARTNRPALSEHAIAARDLRRYYWLLESWLESWSTGIDEAERKLLERMVREGKTGTVEKLKLLWAEVEDAGGTNLARKIREAQPLDLAVVVDTIERGIAGQGKE